MRKIIYTLSLLLTGFCTATAQTLVEQASSLADGDIISLQCRDTNGGAGYYFRLGAVKSATETYENLFQIHKSGNNIKLERLTDGKYVGKSGDDVVVGANNGAGVNFTVSNPGSISGWDSKQTGTNEEYVIRFTTSGTHLNTQPQAGLPKFTGGTGGYSAWYVYKYTQTEINTLEAAYNTSIGRTRLTQPEQLTDGTIISLECRDTNGGASYSFNLNAPKSRPEIFSYRNLFKVNSTNGGGKITASL